MYSLWARASNGVSRYKYPVYERKDEVLMWRYEKYTEYPDAPKLEDCLVLPRCGEQDGKSVTDEEAEILTGLRYPAAMDRLRELVHESGGYT